MLRTLVGGSSALLILGSLLLVIEFDKTKYYVDLYANHATVVGLMLGLAGFILTIWTLFEGLRVNRESQRQVQVELGKYRAELERLLENIRSQTFREACDQAYSCLEQSRHAIRTNDKLRAIEKTEDARKFVLRVLEFNDLVGSEREALRAHVIDLLSTISYIEQKRKTDTEIKLPADKLKPLSLLRDDLDQIRSRLTNNLMGSNNVIASSATKN